TEYIREQLSGRYGSEELFRQGLVVSTTLDSRLQKAAIRALRDGARQVRKRHRAGKPPQGALVALDTTGRILAMVGGLDYGTSPYNRAVVARRQPGSVFKPLIYAAAFERGIHPDAVINDKPLVIRNRDGSTWRPKNYDNRYHGPTSLREALVHSRNIVTIRLLQKIGIRPVLALAHRAGITAPLRPELPLALGASPVSLLEMTGAYTVFAADGLYHAPFAITRVRDRQGRVHPWSRSAARRVISPATARQVSAILAEVIRRGTGRRAAGIPGAAGKTGTSDDNRDAWFIGYTPSVTAGVWLGYDRGRSLGRGETGGRAAAPVWKEFMQATLFSAHRGTP
ncbi:MAG TPA: penicillin-binding protein 1A, partial [Desulfobulbus sp.]|nr:penicillin-binding protein 1A [Desulfobulbus sp.]